MDEKRDDDPVQARLRELFPSCESDCTDGCKYGCLGWLHRFDPTRVTTTTARRSTLPLTGARKELPGARSAEEFAGDDHLLDL
jgi:hypothetical protein